MHQHHNWDIDVLDNQIPWERDIYVALTIEWVKKENERIQAEEAKIKAASGKRK